LIFDPFLKLFASGQTGATCIQFLSRLTWQTGEQGQRFLTRFFNPYMAVFAPTLLKMLPQYSETQLRFKIHLAVNTAIHGLADFSMVMHDKTLLPLVTQADGGPRKCEGCFMTMSARGFAATRNYKSRFCRMACRRALPSFNDSALSTIGSG
jgi:hypothetical protein